MSNREKMKEALKQLDFSVYEGRDHLKFAEERPKTETHVAVVFLGSDVALETALSGLKDWQTGQIHMTFIFSAAALEVLEAGQLIKRYRPNQVFGAVQSEICPCIEGREREKLIEGVDLVYVPNLTQNTAAKLANGIQDDLISNMLWHTLAQGKKVFANPAGVIQPAGVYQSTGNLQSTVAVQPPAVKNSVEIAQSRANAMMQKIMKQHLETLKSFGVSFEMPELKKFGAEKQQKLKQMKDCVILSDDLAQKVITERHILSLTTGSKLALKKGVKVTPLAKEAARKRQIELLQMEEGNNL